MKDKRISALIVAAGMASRMKTFKPLLRLGEKTIIEHVIDTFRYAGIQDIVVVSSR